MSGCENYGDYQNGNACGSCIRRVACQEFTSTKVSCVGDIICHYDMLVGKVNDLERNLKSLRKGSGNDWETGIQNDDRTSVRLLYNELLRIRKCITELRSTKVYRMSDTEFDAIEQYNQISIDT